MKLAAEETYMSLLFAKAGFEVCASEINLITPELTCALSKLRILNIDIATADAFSPEQVNAWGTRCVQ